MESHIFHFENAAAQKKRSVRLASRQVKSLEKGASVKERQESSGLGLLAPINLPLPKRY